MRAIVGHNFTYLWDVMECDTLFASCLTRQGRVTAARSVPVTTELLSSVRTSLHRKGALGLHCCWRRKFMCRSRNTSQTGATTGLLMREHGSPESEVGR